MLLEGIKYPLEVKLGKTVSFSIKGLETKELSLYEIPALVGVLDFVGLGLPFREGLKTIVVLPSNCLGYTRIRIRRGDGQGWFYTDISNQNALALANYLTKISKSTNFVGVNFANSFLSVSKGKNYYKLTAKHGELLKIVYLNENEKHFFVSALKIAVFGRYTSKIKISLVKGSLTLQEKFSFEDKEKEEEWSKKIPILWQNALEKGKYPAITLRELLKQKGESFRSFIRLKVSDGKGERVMVPLPLTWAWGLAKMLEVF